ncbi:hypothetical protein [Massilia sp. ZL223]|uniref:hypothetical protein n=1 Tax=Massilia sp. ZL223 TaxID=2824904 RepID=UPI001B813FB6|nr:hypothetical protein [Massilia sp. ZL223]MBQ5963153.1 hypothetical protein [Massilia sp. ZL223]
MWKQRSYREQFQGDESNAGAGGAAADPGAQAEAEQQHPEGETPDGEQQPAAAAQEAEDEEVVITIGDEMPPAANDDEVDGKPAPQWVKDLRKQARDLARENRELKQAHQAAQQQAAPAVPAVGEKPTLESCDFDGEVYAEKLLAWNDARRKADEATAAARAEQEAAQAAWDQKLTAYKAAGAALRVSDFADAEAAAQEVFNPTQLGIIVNGADNAAHLVYALGKNPAKAKELAAIKDPVKYAFAVAKLETQLKVTPRKVPPAPERKVTGTAAGATSVDNTLERLEAEADRTGDRSKVIAYKRQQRKAAA